MGGAQLAYSIRVENLPPHLRSNVALLAFFEKLFPGQVGGGSPSLWRKKGAPLLPSSLPPWSV